MTIKILIMGLSGAGKTTFSEKLQAKIESMGHSCEHLNADIVRQANGDWDFTEAGRIRQATRMWRLAKNTKRSYCIIDMIAPMKVQRNIIEPSWLIWMDCVDESKYKDTDSIFLPPSDYDFRIPNWDEMWVNYVAERITAEQRRPKFDPRKPTVQMLGRWQPWHKGHRALFERAIAKTGQVCIMIRDCQGWNDSNPFDVMDVMQRIQKDLDPLYQGRYKMLVVPNITNITYGRKVGYTIEEEHFDESITEISATKIRQEMGYK